MLNPVRHITGRIFTRTTRRLWAFIALTPLELISGALPRRQHRFVEAWAELHQDELFANWERLQAGQPPHKIAPLQ
jgi:Domain of unknown function (DUF4160)